jgi:hypothetical protein
MFVSFHGVLIESWRADFIEAGLIADDSMERALQLGGEPGSFLMRSRRWFTLSYSIRRTVSPVGLKATVLGWTGRGCWPLEDAVALCCWPRKGTSTPRMWLCSRR